MKSRVFQRGTLAFVFAGLTALSVPLAAESEMVGPTFEESISYRNARGPTISPDGKSIAFQVASTDWEDNRYDQEIWLVREGEEPFQLTRTSEGMTCCDLNKRRFNAVPPRCPPTGRADRGWDGKRHRSLRPPKGEATQERR